MWRNLLATRGLGLVPVAEPARFTWPGPWLALYPQGDQETCGVAFGIPPGFIWRPAGERIGFDEVTRGFVVAPADVALWSPSAAVAGPSAGRVEAIMIAPAAEADMVAVSSVPAIEGHGLQGDRYAVGEGTFSNPHAVGTDLTLVEAEALEAANVRGGPLTAAEGRRNVVTRGIALNALVGRRFRIGRVECIGRRLCEPCAHLQRLTRPGVLGELVHRGGLRADLLCSGTIRVGDPVLAEGADGSDTPLGPTG